MHSIFFVNATVKHNHILDSCIFISENTHSRLSQAGGGAVFGKTVNPTSTRGADYAHHSTTSPPGFSHLATALTLIYQIPELQLYYIVIFPFLQFFLLKKYMQYYLFINKCTVFDLNHWVMVSYVRTAVLCSAKHWSKYVSRLQ